MNFKDRGIIIGLNHSREENVVVTLLTEHHGLYSGFMKLPKNRKATVGIAEGNLVDFMWQARLHEHLGFAKCELIKSFDAHIITNKTKLYAFNSIVSLVKKAFHEREPHNKFFRVFLNFLEELKIEFKIASYIQLELAILAESGYKIQLDKCGDTGVKEDLYFVSPKTGRAICYSSGKPYADKLLVLPKFLNNKCSICNEQIDQAASLTGYFFERYVLSNHRMPEARNLFFSHVIGSRLVEKL